MDNCGEFWAGLTTKGKQPDRLNPSSILVPEVGVEPTWSCPRWILSPVRLPVSPLRRKSGLYNTIRFVVKDDSLLLQEKRSSLLYLYCSVFLAEVKDIIQAIGICEQGSGFFQHGNTYIGHPIACAAGLAVVSALLNRGLVARCGVQGEKLQTALVERFGQHPNIGDIRGRGLFRGLELVTDRETKATFDPKLRVHARLKKEAFEGGLICYPMGGTIDGVHGDHVLLAPPFIISDAQIGELVDKLGTSVDRVLADVA